MATVVLPLTRLLGAALMALGLFAGPAQAGHYLTHPADKSTRVETAAAAEWSNAKPFPKLNGNAKAKRDANVYITPRYVPKGDQLLGAYSTATAPRAKAAGVAVPGLLGIANQAYRAQGGARPKGAKAADSKYSLADAMRDAIWRKETAAKLRNMDR